MNDHPITAELHQFLQGSTSVDDPGLGQHVEKCLACSEKLKDLLDAAVGQAPAIPPVPGLPRLDVPGYEILRVLGRGGAGVVYEARQVALDRQVALKVLLAGAHASVKERERFAREVEALAKLRHPNLVAVYDAGVHDGVPYLAMELIEGETLRERLANGPIEPDEAARVVHALALALATAHAAGIVHRDLKPANVLLATRLAECSPKLSDFGLARRLDATAHTATGAILGTPGYMAPEQVRGEPARKAADVWGLGAILYECLTGRPPFVGAVPERLSQTVGIDPPAPAVIRRSVPRDLDVICMKCLRKEPARRYHDAGELADDLGRWLRHEPILARPVGVVERGWKWARQRPGVVGLLGLLALALAAGISTSLVLWRRALTNLEQAETALVEVEDQFGMLSSLLTTNVNLSSEYGQDGMHPNEVLADSEATLSRLVEKRPTDWKLRVLLAKLLVNKGSHPNEPNALPILERAAKLLDGMPAKESRDWASAFVRVQLYIHIALRLRERGRHRESLAAVEQAYGLQREAMRQATDPKLENLFSPAQHVGLQMLRCGHSLDEVDRRFAEVWDRPELVGGPDAAEMLRAEFASRHTLDEGERLFRANQTAAARIAARRAADLLSPYYGEKAAIAAKNHENMISSIYGAIALLNRADGSQEALALAVQLRRSLPVLASGARDSTRASHVSAAWDLIGKCQWKIDPSVASLEPFHESLAAQRLACSLAPDHDWQRLTLSGRLVKLGRKYCELGEFEDAERYFREQEALWPRDADRRAKNLRELRKWAANIREGPNPLTPAEQRERQRYLDFAARLEKAKPSP